MIPSEGYALQTETHPTSKLSIVAGAETVWAHGGDPKAAASGPTVMLRGADWARDFYFSVARGQFLLARWFIECQAYGLEALGRVVEVDPERRGGVPVMRGTGFTVAQVLAELAETSGVDDVASSFSLDAADIREMINGLSLIMQRPSASE